MKMTNLPKLAIVMGISALLHATLGPAAEPIFCRMPAAPVTVVSDVALGPDGLLRGQVVNSQGLGVAGVTVALWQQGSEVASGITGERGQFALAVSRGGIYQVVAAEGQAICRVWSPQAAPPSAASGVLIVAGTLVVRGQSSPVYNWIAERPYLFYGGVAAAIAVPLVVLNDDDDDPASP
jgi:hypothetical protein